MLLFTLGPFCLRKMHYRQVSDVSLGTGSRLMFRHLNPFTRLALREASYVKRGMPIAET